MSTFYLTAYCEAAHCVSGNRRANCAELELPERFGDLGDHPDDLRLWALAQLFWLGWSVEDGEHRCPECTEAKRLRELSGINAD